MRVITHRLIPLGFRRHGCRLGLLGALLIAGTIAGAASELRPWEDRAVSLESGVLWQVGVNTPLSYRLVPTQLSWRSSEAFGWDLGPGHLAVRHRFTLLGTWVQQGPESRYIAIAASPSVEWWHKSGRWALYGGAGGGLGGLDSQSVPGAQGQDFTLHWFGRGGVEYRRANSISWTAGFMFQHLSNGGQTKPNPGIDALGFTLGWARSF